MNYIWELILAKRQIVKFDQWKESLANEISSQNPKLEVSTEKSSKEIISSFGLNNIEEVISIQAKIENVIQDPMINKKSIIYKHSYYPFLFVLEMGYLINIFKFGKSFPLFQFIGKLFNLIYHVMSA